MTYSSKSISSVAFSRTARVSWIDSRQLTFDFHDGVESGLVCYEDGPSFRISCIGESLFRIFKAYAVEQLEGDWFKKISAQFPELPRDAWSGFADLNQSFKQLKAIRHLADVSQPVRSFVAIGSLDLSKVLIVAVEPAELEGIRSMSDSTSAYRAAHSLLKSRS